jgi:hypothetical protein
MYHELKLAFLVYLWYPKTRVRRTTCMTVTSAQQQKAVAVDKLIDI